MTGSHALRHGQGRRPTDQSSRSRPTFDGRAVSIKAR